MRLTKLFFVFSLLLSEYSMTIELYWSEIFNFFFSKEEKQKSKEFYKKILSIENVNQDLKIEAQKRLKRDLSE